LTAAALGPYRVGRELGSGGMGTVYAATVEREVAGLTAGTTVALKVVHPHLLQSDGFFKRFLREAKIGQKVEHDNVVRTYDFDAYEVDGKTHHCLAMEYVEGQTLRELLEELGTVPEDLCRHVGSEMAKGLAAIHATGAVHRDIKPENVLITPDHTIKLMDLGVARLVDESVRLSQTGAFVGSVHYAAPEQFRESSKIDGRADLHALGITLFELATGQHPFDAEELPDVIRRVLEVRPPRVCDEANDVSVFFADVIEALVEKKLDDRLPSADRLLEVLRDGERSTWWRDRHRTRAAEKARRVRRLSIRRETPVYGRDAELRRLEQAFERAKAGEGAVVLVEGDAGIGKSRLIDELVRRLAERGEDMCFLHGGFAPSGSGAEFDGVASAFRDFLGAAGSAAHLMDMPLVVPSFDAYVRGETPPEGSPLLRPGSVQTCFVHVLRSIANEHPTILLVDDLHFATKDARDLFAGIARASRGHPVLVIGTMRPGVPPEWIAGISPLEHVDRVVLQRLEDADLVELLAASLRSRTLAEDLARVIGTKIDGNPFFVFEILRALRDEGRLVERENGTWISTSALDDIHMPESIGDIVRGRLAELSEEERELLDMAACHGFRFDARLVAQALGRRPLPVLQGLARLARRTKLVRASEQRFEFDHHQVHEVLYGELLEPLAREYHAMLAQALERTALATRVGEAAFEPMTEVELCDQWARAGSGVRAHALAERAIGHLTGACRLEEALALSGRVLGALGPEPTAERCDLLIQHSSLRIRLGDAKHFESELGEATRIADDLGDDQRSAMARFRRLNGMLLGQSRGLAKELAEETIVYAQRAGDRCLEAASRGALARLALHTTGGDGLIERMQENVQIFEEEGRLDWAWTARSVIADIHLHRGRLEEAIPLLEAAVANGEKTGRVDQIIPALGNLAIAANEQDRYDDSVQLATRQRELARDLGERRGEAEAENILGNAHVGAGRLGEAESHFLRYLQLATEIGHQMHVGIAHGSLGRLCFLEGRHEEALEHRKAHLAVARALGNRQAEAQALNSLGWQEFWGGRFGEADELLRESHSIAEKLALRYLVAEAAQTLAQIAQRWGRYDDAVALHTRALACARAVGIPARIAWSLVGLGLCAADRGELDEAERYCREGLEVAEVQERWLPHARSSLAGVLHLGGRTSEAVELYRSAHDIAARLGLPDAIAFCSCALARLGVLDADTARHELAAQLERTNRLTRLAAQWNLWHATGDAEHLTAAKEVLGALCAGSPPEVRDSMLGNVPLHRDIVAAWEAQEGGTGTTPGATD
jgi:tetratricopeptide (TPR) repeat protein